MRLLLRTSWSVFVGLLLINLGLASCNSSGTPSTTNSSNTNNMTLKVGQNTNAGCFFPLYVAEQENFFKAQGLTLDPPVPPIMGNGTKVSAAIEAGNIDVAGGGVITDAFNLAKVDTSVRLLAALTNGFVNDIVVSKKFEQQAHLSATSTLAQKVKALLGKRIGTSGPGTGTESLVIYLFKSFGYDAQKDATLVNVGSSNTAPLAALNAGRVDAVSFFPPAGQEAETQGIGSIFISPTRGDVPTMRGQLHCLVYARQNVIDTKPKAVQAFIRAIAQAETFIHKNTAQATMLLQKDLHLDQKTIGPVFAATVQVIPQSPQISLQGYNTAAQYHLKAGLIKQAPAYSDMVATNTIDSALKGMSS